MAYGSVAITGARGWIGQQVARRLIGRGVRVTGVAHDTPARATAAAAAAADVVIHAGGVYSNERTQFVSDNVEQAVAVASGCSRTQNTVVFLSSVKVYGWVEHDGHVAHEEDAAPGDDNFSTAKRLVEDLLGCAAHRCVVLRIANVYGREIPRKYALGTMLATARQHGRVTLECTGASQRDFVHMDDVTRVIERAALAGLPGGAPLVPGRHVFNVASGRLVTLGDVAGVFHEVLGARVEMRGGSARSSPAFSNQKVIEAGYAGAFTDPLDGVRSLLEDWRSNPWEAS